MPATGPRSIGGVSRHKILLVDDEPDLRRMVRRYLQAEGFDVAEASDARNALAAHRTGVADLILLDIGLPDEDGFTVLQEIRKTSDTPVIVLTARSEEIDRVLGLTIGADDYVSKPFSPRELVARIRAVLRRGRETSQTPETMSFRGMVIDPVTREVTVDGQTAELTALEFDILTALAEAPRRVFTRAQLLEKVWGWDYFGTERVVDVHIRNLRKALDDDAGEPRFIGTVRGVGYRFLGQSA